MIPPPTWQDLTARYPFVNWREPTLVHWPDVDVYACRVCIAAQGLTRASTWQWPNKVEAVRHIEREHP